MSTDTTRQELCDEVSRAFAQAEDPRLAEIGRAVVRHLHAFVNEVGLTRDEWLAGIRFLTAVGQRCDEARQEFILLSDTLGVSALVEIVNTHAAPGATDPTVLGPFFVEGAEARPFGGSIVDDPATGGEPLLLHGTATDLVGSPVAGASVEVWQVQPSGRYDIEDDPANRNLRGVFETDAAGRYEVRTVRPVDYTIPDDGPVGAMLRAAGRDSWRPAHIHLLVRARGYKTLVTHVFDEDSPRLGDDAVFSVHDSLSVSMRDGVCRFDPRLEPLPDVDRVAPRTPV